MAQHEDGVPFYGMIFFINFGNNPWISYKRWWQAYRWYIVWHRPGNFAAERFVSTATSRDSESDYLLESDVMIQE